MKEKDTRMKNKTRKLEHWQVVTLLLMLYDFTAVALSYCLALWIRFDCKFSRIETRYLQAYGKSILLWIILRCCVLVSAPVQKHLALCQLFRVAESSSSNPAHRSCLHHRNGKLCREDASFLLSDRHRHPVLPDFGNPFFLSLCPAAERKDKQGGR